MTRIRVVRTLLAAAFGVLGLAGAAQAQRVYWDAPGPLGAGQRAGLDLVFADTEPAGRIVPPRVDDLTIAGPPRRASNIAVINGRRSASVTLSYPIRADHAGRFTIPSFDVETTDGPQTVAALTVEVGAATVTGGAHGGAETVDQIVDLRLTPSNMTPYAGQVVDMDLTVGLSAGRSGQVVGTPTWDKPGVLTESWSDGQAVSSQRGSAVRFRTRAVAPEPGRMQIAPVRQELQIETGRAPADSFDGFGDAFGALRKFGGADLFDSFFARAQTASVTAQSNAVQLDVQPLPQPPPAGFSGAVGQFTLESSLAPQQPKTGEPITWTLTLKGTGNWPGGVELPARAVPDDFRALQPKQHKDFADGALFSGGLSEDLVLVPNQPGDYRLDPVRFVYFDPETAQYQTIEARPPLLHITGAPIVAAPKSAPAPAAAVAGAPAAAPALADAAHDTLLPRDPRRGAAAGFAPVAAPRLTHLAAVPFALLLLYWVALAVRRARLTDPRRPQREAFRQLAPAIGRVRAAGAGEERIAALLAWQRIAAAALAVERATPTAGQLPDHRWIDVWSGSERAIYGPARDLPAGWCEHAMALCTQTRRPRFNPLHALRVRHLVSKTAAAALLLALAGAPARAADPLDTYAKGDFAGARQMLFARTQAAPADWIARYDLGLAEAQVGDAPRALGETLAAFVHAPRDPDVRWNANAFAAAVPGFDRGAATLTAAPGIAAALSPAAWQWVLITAAIVCCGGAALMLRWRYGRAAGPRWTAVALLAVGGVGGSAALLNLRAYGTLADPRAALVAGQPVLRSVPTDAEQAQQQRPIAAGTLLVAEQDFLGWVKVGLPSGESGWLRRGDLVPLYAAPSA